MKYDAFIATPSMVDYGTDPSHVAQYRLTNHIGVLMDIVIADPGSMNPNFVFEHV